MKTFVLNGWSASAAAWSRCAFMRDAMLFSYVDALDGRVAAAFEAEEGKVVLVGWSMGGSYALRLAADYPDKIAGLVLVAATPRMMEDRAADWKGMSPRRLEALRRGLEMTGGQGFFGTPEGGVNPYELGKTEDVTRGLKYLFETDLRADLARTFAGGCPFSVHVFQSERDGIVRAENADWLARLFPKACVTRVAGGEHALPVKIPESIDAAVAAVKAQAEKDL